MLWYHNILKFIKNFVLKNISQSLLLIFIIVITVPFRVPLVSSGLIETGVTSADANGPHPLGGLKILDVGCGGGILSEVCINNIRVCCFSPKNSSQTFSFDWKIVGPFSLTIQTKKN